MSRWIDANKLIEFINSKFVVSWKHDYDGGFKDACVEILNAIEDAPTIEIISCRECKWFDSGKNDSEIWSMCTRHFGKYIDVNADGFCSYGEREDER